MNLTYPGVYVEDRPPRTRPIEAAGTSTAAFLGASERGPLRSPIKIFNFQEFEARFGGFLDGHCLAHAVFQFFNNGGTECYVVRTAPGPTHASAVLNNSRLPPSPSIRISAREAGDSALKIKVTHPLPNGDKNRFDLDVLGDGGSVVERLQGVSMRPQDELFVGDQPLTKVALTVLPSQRVAQHDSGIHDEATFGVDPDTAWALTVRQNTDQPRELPVRLVGRDPDDVIQGINAAFEQAGIPAVASVIRSAGTVQFRVSGKTIVTGAAMAVIVEAGVVTDLGRQLGFQNDVATAAWSAAGVHEASEVASLDPDEPLAYTFEAEVDGYTRRLVEVTGALDDDLANLPDLVQQAFDGAFVPELVDVTLKEGKLVLTRTGSGENSYVEVFEENPGEAPTLGFEEGPTYGATINRPAATETPLSGGADHVPNYDEALASLDNIEDVSILAIPGASDPADIERGTSYCEKRKLGCFYIADSPADADTLPEAQNWRTQLTASAYGAAYFPWVKMPNPHVAAGGSIDVPPSGFIAGIYARTDSRRGVWKAPAGVETTLAGTTGLTARLTDQQHGNLNVGRKSVCVLREFAAEGRVVWGARTLAGSSGDRYIPVRRTAIFLKRSIYNGIQWAVFEPNDHRLWAALRANVSAFMNSLFRAEAFQGKRASDAYFVQCGFGSTMTQDDINAGRVIVEVGFAPLKPAEFVIVRIEQMALRPS